MSLKIGDIEIPCVSGFEPEKGAMNTEVISPLGTTLHHVAEFGPDPDRLAISGTLYKKYRTTKTADQYAEDIRAIKYRRSVHNYIHDIQGISGWFVAQSMDIEKRTPPRARRGFSIEGIFQPLSEYWGVISTKPVVMQNGFGVALTDCHNWVTIPRNTISTSAGSTRTVTSEYGLLTQASDDVLYMPTAAQDSIGECRVYDRATRVYNATHGFSGALTVKNGVYSVTVDPALDTLSISYWSGTAYTEIDTFEVPTFDSFYLRVCRPDLVHIVLSSGLEIQLEPGKPAMISGTSPLTCTGLSPANQATGEDNYMVLGEGCYVAVVDASSIVSGVISSGTKWIVHSAAPVQDALDCLVDPQVEMYVARRW
jgi:hypothetical protein